jgi:ribonuclease HI
MDRTTRRPEDDEDLTKVCDLELRLLDPEVRRDRAAVARLLHRDFVEFGASGRVWDAASLLEALEDEPGEGTDVSDLAAQRLSPDVVLVTYGAHTAGQSTLRASVWVREGSSWRVRFHQGTPRRG